jgi:hypothetical protein
MSFTLWLFNAQKVSNFPLPRSKTGSQDDSWFGVSSWRKTMGDSKTYTKAIFVQWLQQFSLWKLAPLFCAFNRLKH